MANRYPENRRDNGKYVLAWAVLFMILFGLGFLAAGIYYL